MSIAIARMHQEYSWVAFHFYWTQFVHTVYCCCCFDANYTNRSTEIEFSPFNSIYRTAVVAVNFACIAARFHPIGRMQPIKSNAYGIIELLHSRWSAARFYFYARTQTNEIMFDLHSVLSCRTTQEHSDRLTCIIIKAFVFISFLSKSNNIHELHISHRHGGKTKFIFIFFNFASDRNQYKIELTQINNLDQNMRIRLWSASIRNSYSALKSIILNITQKCHSIVLFYRFASTVYTILLTFSLGPATWTSVISFCRHIINRNTKSFEKKKKVVNAMHQWKRTNEFAVL